MRTVTVLICVFSLAAASTAAERKSNSKKDAGRTWWWNRGESETAAKKKSQGDSHSTAESSHSTAKRSHSTAKSSHSNAKSSHSTAKSSHSTAAAAHGPAGGRAPGPALHQAAYRTTRGVESATTAHHGVEQLAGHTSPGRAARTQVALVWTSGPAATGVFLNWPGEEPAVASDVSLTWPAAQPEVRLPWRVEPPPPAPPPQPPPEEQARAQPPEARPPVAAPAEQAAVAKTPSAEAPASPKQAPAASKEEWPGWLVVGGELRGRGEMFTSIGFREGVEDLYYLSRVRLNASIQPRPWLRFFAQAQDSQALGYNSRPFPSNITDSIDLRQAYVELGFTKAEPWGLRVGRQELIFGEERLIGASNWGNVARTFDAARLTYTRGQARFDWFASSVVVAVNNRFNRLLDANNLYGFYSSFDLRSGKRVLEPYLLWKTSPLVRGERGPAGDLDVYTLGVRVIEKLPRRFDYGMEVALQRGQAAEDDLSAWAGHWVLGYTLWDDAAAPRLVLEYNYAAGDKNAADGTRGTFDQLYPTNHSKYGTVDRFGWRNIHDAMAGVEWKPRRKLKFNLDYHSFWLATRRDFLYTEGGAAFFRNPAAANNHIGQEIDLQGAYLFSRQLQIGLGYGYLMPGPYLKGSSRGFAASAPYVMWNYKF